MASLPASPILSRRPFPRLFLLVLAAAAFAALGPFALARVDAAGARPGGGASEGVASSDDGGGAAPCFATIEAASPVVADGPATLAFRIQATGAGLARGDTVEIRFPFCAPFEKSQWTTPVPGGAAAGRTIAKGPVTLSVVPYPLLPLCRNQPIYFAKRYPSLLLAVLDEALPAGRSFVVNYGDPGTFGKGAAVAQAFPEEEAPFRFRWRAGAGGDPQDVPLRGSPLAVGRRPSERLHLSGPAQAKAGESVSFLLAALDAYGFPGAAFPADARIVATDESGKTSAGAAATAEARDPCARRAEITFDHDGVWWVSASATGLSAAWDLPVVVGAAAERTLFFGDVHWHTNRSDGSRSPREGYRYARDVVGLDFTARTDHDVHYVWPCLTDQTWQEEQDLAREFDDPGRFASLLGYEWTDDAGHQNVYYRANAGKLLTSWDYKAPTDLWAALPSDGSVLTIPHHPASLAQPHMQWEFFDDRFVKTVEVYSNKGDSEVPLTACSPHAPPSMRNLADKPRKGNLQEGWSHGYDFYVLASTDDHLATPGNPVRERERFDPRSECPGHGLCAAWVSALTHEEIFDALRDGRTYGTTGPRIRIETLPWKDGDRVKGLTARVVAAAPVREVKLVGIPRQGDPPFPERDITDTNGNERIVELRWDRTDAPDFRGAYLRVTQADGEMAWSSPIFFEGAKAAK